MIRPLGIKDINQVLDLAYKAVFERGWVGVDFNRQDFNFKVKHTLVHKTNMCWGQFVDQKLIGFVVAMLEQVPWTTETRCHVDLVHLDVEHRSLTDYQLLINTVMTFCKENKIKNISTHNNCYLLSNEERMILLQNSGFYQQDVTWERINEN